MVVTTPGTETQPDDVPEAAWAEQEADVDPLAAAAADTTAYRSAATRLRAAWLDWLYSNMANTPSEHEEKGIADQATGGAVDRE